jgi:hypothetical protein
MYVCARTTTCNTPAQKKKIERWLQHNKNISWTVQKNEETNNKELEQMQVKKVDKIKK